jgi:Helix-turn-helix domain
MPVSSTTLAQLGPDRDGGNPQGPCSSAAWNGTQDSAHGRAPPLTSLSEAQRALALERFALLHPHLEEGVPLSQLAQHQGLPLRTAQRWLKQYHAYGLGGLVRKVRADRVDCCHDCGNGADDGYDLIECGAVSHVRPMGNVGKGECSTGNRRD